MFRRLLLATTAVVFSVALVRGAADVTFVMKNGERVSGTFSYNHTDHYQLIVNGQMRDYPAGDIAMVAFVAGDPSAREINALPDVNDPPELERHTIVLRSGEMVRGKIWDFQGNTVIMDIHPGDRRTYNMGDVARLYISAPGSRGVFGNHDITIGGRGRGRFGRGGSVGNTAGAGPTTPAVTVDVPATKTWVDSGVVVNQGDKVWFTVSGQVYMSSKQRVGADGVPNSVNRKDNPLPSANSGAMLGMVGRSMFLIGSNTGPITMAATGQLMLGINDDQHRDNRDSFTVSIRR